MNGSWKFTFFIARKLQKQHIDPANRADKGKKVARPITRIATISIALAMIVNIITIAVVDGFQQEVRHKVIGFGSHISIQNRGEGSLFESSPLRLNTSFVAMVSAVKGVTHIQPVAYKPALFQSVSDEDQREILGVVLKGVNQQYDWTFMKAHLKSGRIPDFSNPDSEEILISKRICSDLHYKLGDTAKAYFVKQQPILRNFKIVGIYETGLEDFDKEIIFCNLRQVQRLNDWGIQASISIDDTLASGEIIIRGDVTGGNGNHRYDWGKGFEQYQGFTICPTKDTTIRLIAADYWSQLNEPVGSEDAPLGETAIADTAYLHIKISGDRYAPCSYRLEDGSLTRTYLDDEGYKFSLNAGSKTLTFQSIPGKGSFHHYIGSYELMVKDWNQLDYMKEKLSKTVHFTNQSQAQLEVKSIKDHQKELFVWLGFLDINMAIILILMLVIGIINMGSALLVMILVRTNFIGVMKSIGATNWLIQKLFVVQGGRLILKGMIWGNLIGIGLSLLQMQFGILKLDAKVYYLTQVPIYLDPFKLIVLNGLTLIVCVLALLVPSIVITRISPAKTIRFR
ncbi:MAG: ABC transporter permease [Fluviicola sp.]|nr:ABC transporter permease [Fluviicola sp.]